MGLGTQKTSAQFAGAELGGGCRSGSFSRKEQAQRRKSGVLQSPFVEGLLDRTSHAPKMHWGHKGVGE